MWPRRWLDGSHNASPTSGLRPGRPSHAPTTTTPRSASSRTPPISLAEASRCDDDVERVGAAGAMSAAVRQARRAAAPVGTERLEQAGRSWCGTRGTRTDRAPRSRPNRPTRSSASSGNSTSRISGITSALARTASSAAARFSRSFGRELVEVFENPVDPAVSVDQLGRGLLADAGHARQVVGGVAAHRRRIRRSCEGARRCASSMPASSYNA